MISKNPAKPLQPATPTAGDAPAAEAPPVLDPRAPIEVASGGGGTVNDPSGSDPKPPGYDNPDIA